MLSKFNFDSMFTGFSMHNPPHFSTGKIMSRMDEPSIGHMVVKCGTITGLTHGLLAVDGGIFRLENQELRLASLQGQNFPERITMYGQYLVEFIKNHEFFDLGDSGSLVFMHDEDKSLKCVGMAVGKTSHGGCIVTPIEAILEAFGINDGNNGPPFLPFNDTDDNYGDDRDENRFPENERSYRHTHPSQPDNGSGMDHSGLGGNFGTSWLQQYQTTDFADHIDLPHSNSSDSDDIDTNHPLPTLTSSSIQMQIKQPSYINWSWLANTFRDKSDIYRHLKKEKGKTFQQKIHAARVVRFSNSMRLNKWASKVPITMLEVRKGEKGLQIPYLPNKTCILYGLFYIFFVVFKTTFGSEEELIFSQFFQKIVSIISFL